MNNKKLVLATVAFIVLIRVGIYSFSFVFETTWQDENRTDNTLTVNQNVAYEEQTAFDYPFVVDNGQSIVWNVQNIAEPPVDALTWQAAANKAGETIKDIFGITNHQKNTAKMCYFNFPSNARFSGSTYYYISQWETTVDDMIEQVSVWAIVEAYTGEVLLMNCMDKTANDRIEWKLPTDDIKKKLLEDTSDFLIYMGKPEIERFKIGYMGLSTEGDSSNVVKTYMLLASLSDGQLVQLYFDMDSDTDHKLLSYNNHSWMNNIQSTDLTDWEYASNYI